ncbi:hypothetical protein HPB50_028402 [Hyalomma asiaticum]|nr:hypothetical protein HPB50_028402 [Hyalomma asiaticum]
MPKGRRRRVQEATLATIPTCVACFVIGVVLLLLLAAVFTKEYLLPAYEKFRERQAAAKTSETESSWSPTYWTRKRANPLLCRSTACKWIAQNVLDRVDWKINPCDDFYAHVCAAERRPYEAFAHPLTPVSAAVSLVGDLELLFRRYSSAKREALNGAETDPEDNFFSQMIWVYDECRKEAANGDRLVSPELDAMLDELGLLSWETRQLSQVVARADSLLRLGSLFSVAVKPSRTFPNRGDEDGLFVLALGPPETLYRRFTLKTRGASEMNYMQLVRTALCSWNTSSHACNLAQEPLKPVATVGQEPVSNVSSVTDQSSSANHSMAAEIVALEKELDKATMLPGDTHDTSPRYSMIALKDLPSNEAWNWTTYFRTLLAGSNESIDDDVFISVSKAVSLQDLLRAINSSLDYVVVNYVTFRVLVELSPFLGRDGEDLLTLTHDLEADGLKHRQVAVHGYAGEAVQVRPGHRREAYRRQGVRDREAILPRQADEAAVQEDDEDG